MRCNMIKLKEIINEAPVDTYQTIGDFSKGHSFRDKRDRDLVVHPTAIQKVKDFFKNTSVDFDFYFVNLKGVKRFEEKGKVSEDFIYKEYPNGLGIKSDQLTNGKINSDNITVFFVGNSAAEKIPMTSWTIAHRFGHVLRFEPRFEEYDKWLDTKFMELLELYRVSQPMRTYDDSYYRNLSKYNKAKCMLFNQIGTMKSARDGKIDRYSEFYYELFAQYLKNGEIKLNPLNRVIVKGYAAYGRKETAHTQNMEDVNYILSEIERDFKYYAENVLSDSVGNIYVM